MGKWKFSAVEYNFKIRQLSKRTLIWIIIIWVLLTLINYYFVPYFIVAFEWLGMSLGLFIWTIIQVVKTVKERKSLTKQRLFALLTISVLFALTFYRQPVSRLIENIDWYVFYSKRLEVVDYVKQGKLAPNVSWNNWVCELPYELPVISNGGNDIGISKNDNTGKVTVTFWVFRNFFSAPSTHFVYTDDPEEMETLNSMVKNNPEDNWKININWFRTFHE